ncbi:MAG: hypothetical protein AAB850_00045 [Patescibacteria group bacterium]
MTQQRITGLSAEELEDLLQLLPRIFCDYRDPRRGPYKLAFIFGNTIDNEMSSFLRAVELAKTAETKSLGVSEGSLGFGYEGYDHSVGLLKALGLKDTFPIVKFDVGGNVNTGFEAKVLAEHAKSIAGGGRDGGDIAIIATPFHIVRAFMTTVTALKRNGDIPVWVYAVPGIPLPWTEEAVHSQGTLKKKRKELLVSELQRLEKYRAPEFGGMLSAREVINYLDWRDS